MRVIEPRQTKPTKRTSRRMPRPRKLMIVGVSVFVLLGIGAWWSDLYPEKSLSSYFFKSTDIAVETKTPDTQLVAYTSSGFSDLYSTFDYPNTQQITVQPTITGNVLADERIKTIAEKRGYRLQSTPVARITKTDEPDLSGDDLLQPLALGGWQDLKAAAKLAGVALRLQSAYRSLEYQRRLFLNDLSENATYATDIANGLVDDKVDRILATTAPPGYSRHHTGYAIDLACYPGGVFVTFATSPCNTWLSANNYENAKKHGWIPSYPVGTAHQGPEPEPWEYVWVGKDRLTN